MQNSLIQEKALSVIAGLDLDPIKFKLMQPEAEEGKGWTLDQANAAEKWYKRFLFLNLKHPTFPIVPTKAIDVFWHYHILDTMKYAEDCHSVFGYFLHHFPYFGMRGEEDQKNLVDAFDGTSDLFFTEFGESLNELRKVFPSTLYAESAACEGTECGGTACGSSNCDGGDKGMAPFDLGRPTLSSLS